MRRQKRLCCRASEDGDPTGSAAPGEGGPTAGTAGGNSDDGGYNGAEVGCVGHRRETSERRLKAGAANDEGATSGAGSEGGGEASMGGGGGTERGTAGGSSEGEGSESLSSALSCSAWENAQLPRSPPRAIRPPRPRPPRSPHRPPRGPHSPLRPLPARAQTLVGGATDRVSSDEEERSTGEDMEDIVTQGDTKRGGDEENVRGVKRESVIRDREVTSRGRPREKGTSERR